VTDTAGPRTPLPEAVARVIRVYRAGHSATTTTKKCVCENCREADALLVAHYRGNSEQEATRRDSPPDAVAALAEALRPVLAGRVDMDPAPDEYARRILAALPPGWTLTRNQDAAVLALHKALNRALLQWEMYANEEGSDEWDDTAEGQLFANCKAVLSDHSAAAQQIRERVERMESALRLLRNTYVPAGGKAQEIIDRALLATQQPAEGGDGHEAWCSRDHGVNDPCEEGPNTGRQVMADLWAEYDRIVRDPERVIAPQAAARKAIVDEVERALIARIARLNRGEDYALAVRIEEARALLDQQGNDTLRLAELPDSQRNIDRETGKRLSYD
jgi:hypothetical protein